MEEWAKQDIADRDIKEQTLKVFLKNDFWAIKLCLDVWDAFQIWDDMVDKTHDRTEFDINHSYRVFIVELSKNPFYLKHISDLMPIINLCIMQWTDANKLEKLEGEDYRNKAYMLRACIFNLFRYCAYLVGGHEWGDTIGPDIWNSYGETLEGFLKEMEDEFKHS